MYYLRTRAAADAIKFTVDTTLLKVNGVHVCPLHLFTIFSQKLTESRLRTHHKNHLRTQVANGKPAEDDVEAKMAQMICSLNNREECLACRS